MSSRSVTQDLKALHIWGGGKPFSDAKKQQQKNNNREGIWHILISTVGPLQCLTSNLTLTATLWGQSYYFYFIDKELRQGELQ